MRYVPIIGIGLVVWGLVTLDWVKVALGAAMFFGGFAVALYKKRTVLKSGALFSVYKPLHQLIVITRKSIDASAPNADDPKAKLASALFFMGMIDAASQAAGLVDKDFLELHRALFHDLDYDESMRSRILLFHQAAQVATPGYTAIMKGGETYTKFANGNQMIVILAGRYIEEMVKNPKFPKSVDAL